MLQFELTLKIASTRMTIQAYCLPFLEWVVGLSIGREVVKDIKVIVSVDGIWIGSWESCAGVSVGFIGAPAAVGFADCDWY